MNQNYLANLKQMRVGMVLVLLSLMYGFGLGIYFGVFEDQIKGGLKADAQAVLETVYQGDEAKMNKITKKSWTYIKRAHFHATGMGTTGLVLILALAMVPAKRIWRSVTAFLLSFGALFYPICWMLAGRAAPALGSTGLAKDELSWLARPAATGSAIGVALALFIILSALFSSKEEEP